MNTKHRKTLAAILTRPTSASIVFADIEALIKAGIRVTVEHSSVRAIGIDGYIAAGCEIAAENLWPEAPADSPPQCAAQKPGAAPDRTLRPRYW